MKSSCIYALRHPTGCPSPTSPPANVAEIKLTEELLFRANLGRGEAHRLFGDLAYRSKMLEEDLVGRGIRLVTDSAEQGGKRQQVKIAFASLKREFRLGGRSPPRSPALRPGSRPSSPPTPAPSCSTATLAVLRDGLKSCGPENRETLI